MLRSTHHSVRGTLQKILFAFGYFPLYEYGVKSRNYALGLLFVVVTCVFMLLMQRAFFSPDFSIMTETWGPSLGLEGRRLQQLYGIYACGLLATIVVCYRHRPVAQIVFLCCGTGLLHFFMLIHGYAILRHYGFFMIALLLLVWGGRYLTVWTHSDDTPMKGVGTSFGGLLLTGLLAIHAVSGLRAVALDVERPFSLGKRAAEYIEAENLDSLPMIGNHDSIVSTVVGYLRQKRAVHYVPGNREGTFIRWDIKRETRVDESVVLSQTQALADRTGSKILMILSHPLSPDLPAQCAIRPLASFTGAIDGSNESFYLYLYENP